MKKGLRYFRWVKTTYSVVLVAAFFITMVPALAYAQKAKPDLKKIADKIVKTYNSADPGALVKIYAENALLIEPGEAPMRGHAAIKKYVDDFYRALPDWKGEFTSILFSEDTIAFELDAHGTFTGPMATPQGQIAPTGKTIKAKYVFLVKIGSDGLIVEDRTYFDNFDFMKQLGLLK
jgi:predicted ester cyclase